MTGQLETDASELMPAVERINTSLLNSHIFFLCGDIDEYSVGEAIKWIIYENTIDEPEKELTMYINSSGGSFYDAFALVDIMRQSKYPINTVGIGLIASAGFLIFACGTKGKRVISKNTAIMCHQFSGAMIGKQHDIDAHIKEFELAKNRLVQTLTDVTKLQVKDVKSKLLPPSDVWFTPEELIKFGVADIIG